MGDGDSGRACVILVGLGIFWADYCRRLCGVLIVALSLSRVRDFLGDWGWG